MSTDIEVDMNQSPKLFATEHGHKQLVEFHGVEVRVGVLLEADIQYRYGQRTYLMNAMPGPLHHATSQARLPTATPVGGPVCRLPEAATAGCCGNVVASVTPPCGSTTQQAAISWQPDHTLHTPSITSSSPQPTWPAPTRPPSRLPQPLQLGGVEQVLPGCLLPRFLLPPQRRLEALVPRRVP